MGRPGRKRGTRKRYPNGQTKHAEEAADILMTTARIRETARREASKQEYGTELGRLYLLEKIPTVLYEAGRQYLKVVSTYRKFLECPKSVAAVQSYGAVNGRGASTGPSRDEAKLRQTYDAAFCCLRAVAPARSALLAVNALVVEDRYLMPRELQLARKGLEALAFEWGLTPRAKTR